MTESTFTPLTVPHRNTYAIQASGFTAGFLVFAALWAGSSEWLLSCILGGLAFANLGFFILAIASHVLRIPMADPAPQGIDLSTWDRGVREAIARHKVIAEKNLDPAHD